MSWLVKLLPTSCSRTTKCFQKYPRKAKENCVQNMQNGGHSVQASWVDLLTWFRRVWWSGSSVSRSIREKSNTSWPACSIMRLSTTAGSSSSKVIWASPSTLSCPAGSRSSIRKSTRKQVLSNQGPYCRCCDITLSQDLEPTGAQLSSKVEMLLVERIVAAVAASCSNTGRVGRTCSYHSMIETKWPPFCRRHFQIHFLAWKKHCILKFWNFAGICSWGSNGQ